MKPGKSEPKPAESSPQPAPASGPPGPGDEYNPFDDDYEPHLHRQVEKPTNNFETLMHLLKCSIGTGILAMPQAFSNAGLITASISTIIIGAIITHSLRILINSQYALCKRNHVALMPYNRSMKKALEIGPNFSKKCAGVAPPIVDLFLVVYQLGICCVYIVFIAENMKKMIDPIYKMSLVIHMLIFLLPLLAFNCIRNLKVFAPFSTVANVLILASVLILTVLLLIKEKLKGEVNLWGDISSFPLFFGSILFSLTAVGVVIAVENNMKTPKDFVKPFGVLNIGMSIVVLSYVGMGILGQMYCRTQCADVITLNLDEKHVEVKVTMVMFVVAIFISYVLHCYVPIEVIWKGYILPRLQKAGTQRLLLWEYVVRIFICLFTFGIAMAIPMLGLIISLAGALCLSALGLIFPAMMEICVCYTTNFGPGKIKLVKDIFIIIIGFLGMFTGTFFTIKAMVKRFQQH